MDERSALRNAILRRDLASFIAKAFATLCPGEAYQDNWHIDYLAQQLAPAASRQRLRPIINLPPRSLKSLAISVAFPAWLLGHDPSCRIISCSYADELARKHARDTRTILESTWYSGVFPATRINRRKNTETEITTTRQGFRLAASTGGTLTGRGGNVLIIDDPIKPADAESEVERRRANDWFDRTLYSRLDDKRAGVIVVVMQRLHEDDLTGYLIEKGGFEVVSLPAIAAEDQTLAIGGARTFRWRAGAALHPDRESLETLEQIRASIGSRVFEAQYQQSPVPADGNLFKSDWIARYAQAPARERSTPIVQSWDTATKLGDANDYSVCTTWAIHKNQYYLLDVHRDRWAFPDLLRMVKAQAEKHGVDTILIEDANSGAALIQTLRQESRHNVIGIKVTSDKRTRAAQQSAVFEAGRVHLPEAAPWLAAYERELLAFPNGRHDDQVDSSVQFLQWASACSPFLSIVLQGAILEPLARNDGMWRVPRNW